MLETAVSLPGLFQAGPVEHKEVVIPMYQLGISNFSLV